MFKLFYTLLFILLVSKLAYAQNEDSLYHDTSKYVHFYSYNNPLLLEQEEVIDDVNEKIKKKRERGFLGIFKKKIYFDHRVRRGFTRSGYGLSTTTETFHTLKVQLEPSIYVRDIYWYNYRKREVTHTKADKVDLEFGALLHGPYKRSDYQGNVIEEGFFYAGTKHETWMKYAKNREYTIKDTIPVEAQQLVSKIKYYKGWPKDSDISFYDGERTMIKEVVPIVNCKKQGEYFKFYKNGWYQETGRYENDRKVGKWIEFYPHGKLTALRKKEVQYPDSPYVPETEPVLLKTWDKNGEVTFELK